MHPSQRLFFQSAVKLFGEHNSHLAATKRTSAYRLVSFPEQPPLSLSQKNAANKLFSKPTRFLLSIPDPKALPAYRNPEVAFVGRSNVGKSSLINRLVNNSKLVKTSSKPGHTRALNFFDIAGQITLVDMPGYGFRSREEWGELILEYLGTRKQLKRLFILVDASAGLKETDRQLMQMLDDQPLSYQVVLTKRDRLTADAFDKARDEIEQYLVKNAVCCYPQLLATGKRRKAKNHVDQAEEDITSVRWAVMAAASIKPNAK